MLAVATPTAAENCVDRTGCDATRHGTYNAYDWWGCRCPDAREDWRLYRKRLREGRQPPALIPAIGMARRIQALTAIGYCWRDLSQRLGVSDKRVRQYAEQGDVMAHRRNVARVTALFDQLSATPGPSKRARTMAARYGYAPPLAWDDIDDPNEQPNLGEPDGTADVVDIVAVWRVFDGHAPISVLRNAAEEKALWLHWVRYRDEYGLDGPGLVDFARRYGVEEKEAQRMRTAAVGRPTRNTKTTTAASRGRSAERSVA